MFYYPITGGCYCIMGCYAAIIGYCILGCCIAGYYIPIPMTY